jgi:hypothetical protein
MNLAKKGVSNTGLLPMVASDDPFLITMLVLPFLRFLNSGLPSGILADYLYSVDFY